MQAQQPCPDTCSRSGYDRDFSVQKHFLILHQLSNAPGRGESAFAFALCRGFWKRPKLNRKEMQ
jgi:hypothetical protein